VNAAEHLAWAQERAMEYIELGDVSQAMASFLSDLTKHPGTDKLFTSPVQVLYMHVLMTGDPREARRFVAGFRVMDAP